jgi:hypothetical protein
MYESRMDAYIPLLCVQPHLAKPELSCIGLERERERWKERGGGAEGERGRKRERVGGVWGERGGEREEKMLNFGGSDG